MKIWNDIQKLWFKIDVGWRILLEMAFWWWVAFGVVWIVVTIFKKIFPDEKEEIINS